MSCCFGGSQDKQQVKPKVTKVLVLFYSTYGHLFHMANAVVAGAKEVEGVEVVLKRIPETLPQEVLAKMFAVEAQKVFEHIPVATPQELVDYDAIILGYVKCFVCMSTLCVA